MGSLDHASTTSFHVKLRNWCDFSLRHHLCFNPKQVDFSHDTFATSLASANTPTQQPVWQSGNVDTVNNWHWHSEVSLAPPQSDFSTPPQETKQLYVSQCWLMLPACLFPPAAVTKATWLHFRITLKWCADSLWCFPIFWGEKIPQKKKYRGQDFASCVTAEEKGVLWTLIKLRLSWR